MKVYREHLRIGRMRGDPGLQGGGPNWNCTLAVHSILHTIVCRDAMAHGRRMSRCARALGYCIYCYVLVC